MIGVFFFIAVSFVAVLFCLEIKETSCNRILSKFCWAFLILQQKFISIEIGLFFQLSLSVELLEFWLESKNCSRILTEFCSFFGMQNIREKKILLIDIIVNHMNSAAILNSKQKSVLLWAMMTDETIGILLVYTCLSL